MEIKPNPSSADAPSQSIVHRPGEYLAQIRLKKEISLEQVSKDIAIPVKTLIALEKDDYKMLPEATFIRGFLRAYARYLQVDSQGLVQDFDRLYKETTGQSTENSLTSSPLQIKGKLIKTKKTGFSTGWVKLFGYVLAFVLFVAFVIWSVQKVKNFKAETQANHSTVEVIDLNAKKTIAISPQPTQAKTASTGDRLKIEFKRPTSVHIEDAKGTVLATGRQANTLELSGQSPFKIRIDDATVTTLRLNDENIDLSKRMVNGKVDFRLAR